MYSRNKGLLAFMLGMSAFGAAHSRHDLGGEVFVRPAHAPAKKAPVPKTKWKPKKRAGWHSEERKSAAIEKRLRRQERNLKWVASMRAAGAAA